LSSPTFVFCTNPDKAAWLPRMLTLPLSTLISSCEAGNLVVVCDAWGSGFVRRQQTLDGEPVYVAADQLECPTLKGEGMTCLGRVCGIIRAWG
jgi:hypothetical protein